ncbi:MAG: hypothetical protein WBW84_16525 [Acidobacteriaceae bacterium]
MGLNEIVAALDDEISRLQKVRELLAGTNGKVARSSASFAFGTNQAKAPRKRRQLSAEARARISAAQKKRWAAQKKAAK